MLDHRLAAAEDEEHTRGKEQQCEPEKPQRHYAVPSAKRSYERHESNQAANAGYRARCEQAIDERQGMEDRLIARDEQDGDVPPERVECDQREAPAGSGLIGVLHPHEQAEPPCPPDECDGQQWESQLQKAPSPLGPACIQQEPVVGEQQEGQHRG